MGEGKKSFAACKNLSTRATWVNEIDRKKSVAAWKAAIKVLIILSGNFFHPHLIDSLQRS